MKKTVFVALLVAGLLPLRAQENKTDQQLTSANNQPAVQGQLTSAVMKTSSRLFAEKDDLTSVILIVPADSVVTVLGSDSSYYHVNYQGNEGYILKQHAELSSIPVSSPQNLQPQPQVQQAPPADKQQEDRYSYLENKYGSKLASRLMAGKIWKGMNEEMVTDSWGSAQKINRVINRNVTREEWIYGSTWLYFENNILVEWGPVKK